MVAQKTATEVRRRVNRLCLADSVHHDKRTDLFDVLATFYDELGMDAGVSRQARRDSG
jgi:hypothetical protein